MYKCIQACKNSMGPATEERTILLQKALTPKPRTTPGCLFCRTPVERARKKDYATAQERVNEICEKRSENKARKS